MKKILLTLAFLLIAGTAFGQTVNERFLGCIPFENYQMALTCNTAWTYDDVNSQLQIGQTNVTSSAAELNILTGVTCSATELNNSSDISANASDLTEESTLTTAQCGQTFFLNASTEFATTLPTATAGCSYRFVVKAAPASASYTVVTPSSANIIYGGIKELRIVGDGGATSDSPAISAGDTITITDGTAVVGDWFYLISDGTNWYLRGQAKAAAGIEPTQAS